MEQAWDELHAALPAGWFVGTPVNDVERDQWTLYAYDAKERAQGSTLVARAVATVTQRSGFCTRF